MSNVIQILLTNIQVELNVFNYSNNLVKLYHFSRPFTIYLLICSSCSSPESLIFFNCISVGINGLNFANHILGKKARKDASSIPIPESSGTLCNASSFKYFT